MRRIACATATAAAILLAGGAQAGTAVPVGHFHSISIEGMGHVTFVHGDAQRVVLNAGDTNNTRIYVKDGNQILSRQGMVRLGRLMPVRLSPGR